MINSINKLIKSVIKLGRAMGLVAPPMNDLVKSFKLSTVTKRSELEKLMTNCESYITPQQGGLTNSEMSESTQLQLRIGQSEERNANNIEFAHGGISRGNIDGWNIEGFISSQDIEAGEPVSNPELGSIPSEEFKIRDTNGVEVVSLDSNGNLTISGDPMIVDVVENLRTKEKQETKPKSSALSHYSKKRRIKTR